MPALQGEQLDEAAGGARQVLAERDEAHRLGGQREAERAAKKAEAAHADSIDDIAEILQCRPGTVRSLLRRGLASLREVLTDGS